MSTEIRLTPELLLAQSSEMNSLATEYGSIFAQAKNVLQGMNESFSTNIASNFVSKISLAQNSFAKIVEMLNTGAEAANDAAKTFAAGVGINESLLNTDSSLGSAIEGDGSLFDNVIKKGWDAIIEKGIDTGAKAVKDALPIGDGFADGIFGKTVEEALKVGVHNISNDYKELYQMISSGDVTPDKAANLFAKHVWHGVGSLAEGNANVMKEYAFKIPGLEDYYKSIGANTDSGTSVLSHSVGQTISTITGDDSWNETYSIYDNGVGEGMVNALKDIGSFGIDKAKEIFAGIGFHAKGQ